MERYSLIVVSDETSPIRRFDVPKDSLRRWLGVGGVVAAIGLLVTSAALCGAPRCLLCTTSFSLSHSRDFLTAARADTTESETRARTTGVPK